MEIGTATPQLGRLGQRRTLAPVCDIRQLQAPKHTSDTLNDYTPLAAQNLSTRAAADDIAAAALGDLT